MARKFDENTRVKIPATLQFLRLGYHYQSLKDSDIDFDTKMFVNRFKPAIEKINGRSFTDDEILQLISEIHSLIRNNDISNSLIYMMLKEHSAIYKKANTGSTVPHANAKFINQLKFPIPKNNSYFSKKFDVIFDQIKVYKDQNQELASLRDFLLPLLMNDQVTFKEAY